MITTVDDGGPGAGHGRLFTVVGWAATWANAAVTQTHRLRDEFAWRAIQADVAGNDVALRFWRFDHVFPVVSEGAARRLDELHVVIGDVAMAWIARLVTALPDHESVNAMHEMSQAILSGQSVDRRGGFKGEASEGPALLGELRVLWSALAAESDAKAGRMTQLEGLLPMDEVMTYRRRIAELADEALQESKIVYRDVARALYEPLLPALPALPDVCAARPYAIAAAGRSVVSQWMYALARGGLNANEIEDTLRSLGPAYAETADWWRKTCAGGPNDELPARIVLPG